MNVRAFVVALAALVIGIFYHAAAWAGEKVGDIEAAVQPLPNVESKTGSSAGTPAGTTHGYIEYRVQLRNSSNKEHIVHLSYPGDTRYGDINHGVVAARTVRVAGGQEVSVSMYQPPMDAANSQLEVRVEGVRDSMLISVTSPFLGWQGHFYGSRAATPHAAVLLSRSVPQDFRDRGQKKAGSGSPASGKEANEESPEAEPQDASAVAPTTAAATTAAPNSSTATVAPAATGSTPTTPPVPDPFDFFRSELPVSQWSANWLGYSCYDVILVTQREAEQMPAAVQLAIRRFIECGGTLLVHGQKVPDAFTQGGTSDDARGICGVGFGQAVASLAADDSDWDATYKKLTTTSAFVYQPAAKPSNLYDLLVKEVTVPVRGLFIVVMLFGIGIGPVNIWLLSKFKRRIWLWWNVPAISLLTCLAVFLYASFSEGWTGHGKVASFTFLDERCHRATTLGYLSYYCPLTPSTGPRFGVDTDVALLNNEPDDWRHRYRRETHLRFVDWTADQHLAAGWVNARVPTYFQIRKNEDRRQRITVQQKGDGSVTVVNMLGADISRLYLADASGKLFEGHDIAAGAQASLTPAANGNRDPKAGQAHLRTFFSSPDWLAGLHFSTESPTPGDMISPGCYVAFLRESPFVEKPLEDVVSEDTVAIVYGVSKGADDGR